MRDLAIVITTFNKPSEVAANLQDFAMLVSEGKSNFIQTVFVVDQGSDKVEAHLSEQAIDLGDLPVVFINQDNFGGSGGFTRGIIEALKMPAVEYVMLLDDDARIDLPSIKKVYQIALDNTDKIIGAPMRQPGEVIQTANQDLSRNNAFLNQNDVVIDKKTYLYPNYGEIVNRKIWGLEPQKNPGGDIDFTGWWMTLIPRSVIKRIGLPLPFFIKWDDAEYGLRAKLQGVKMLVPEDVGVFHENWRNTPQRYNWQSYYWQRNKFIVALLYAEKVPFLAIFLNLLILLKMSLIKGSSAATLIRFKAMDDVLSTNIDLFYTLLQNNQDLLNLMKAHQVSGKRLKAIKKTIVSHINLLKNWHSVSEYYQIALECRFDYVKASQRWGGVFNA